jgi:SulP family sulfate permease
MKRMSETVVITKQVHEELIIEAGNIDLKLPPKTVVFTIEGPFFFGAAQHLESALEHVHGHAETLVLRLNRVPFIDATGMQSLRDLLDTCKRHKTRLVLCEARPNVLEKLKVSGLVEEIGTKNMLEKLHQINHQQTTQ